MIIQQATVETQTPSGSMQCKLFRPTQDTYYSCLIFYSEIFQITAPIERSARIMTGHGFAVLVPEVFHELNPKGTILAYDDAGKDKGNQDKFTKTLEAHDADTISMIEYLKSQPFCNGNIGAMGVCIGGHLAFRAALDPSILSAYCLYATDIHSNTLPSLEKNDSFSRMGDIKGKVSLVWGKQDPHVPTEGRLKIYDKLVNSNINYEWKEVNAQHAFMRDEGERYDAALALECYQAAVNFFRDTL